MGSAAWAQGEASSVQTHRIIVGGDHNYPPYEFLDENGQAAGFNIDLMNAVGQVMGLQVEHRLAPWKESLGAFKEGRIDVLPMFSSEERQQFANFSEPFAILDHALFIRRDSPGFFGLKDLAGREVIVQRDAWAYDCLRRKCPDAKPILVETEPDAMRLLSSGKHQCALVTRIGGRSAIRRLGLTNITSGSPPLLPRDYCLAVKKGNTALLDRLNRGLQILHATGRYDEIHEKWLGEESALRNILRYLLPALAVAGAILIAISVWTWSLRRRVANRTRELRDELAKRKEAEEQLTHLHAVLRAVRNVNQLIVREKDRDRLLQGACDLLIEARGYHNIWIALLDERRRLVAAVEAGLGDEFLPLAEQLRRGNLPRCADKALTQPKAVSVPDPPSDCADCPLSETYAGRGALCARLEYRGKIYGVLVASTSTELVGSEEEQDLFEEVAGDMAFALHGMELEEKRKQAEGALRESEERLKTAGKAAYDLIYEWDVASDSLEWFGNIDGLLGYKKGEISQNISAWLDLIHPDDRVKLEKAVEHHRTSTEPIQYEYRIRHKDGAYRHWNDHGLPLVDDKGCPDKWVGVCTDITERKHAEEQLQDALRQAEKREKEVSALLHGAQTVLRSQHFEEAARSIFDACRELTGAIAGYVALLSIDGTENEVLFLEAGGLPCRVDPSLPMSIRGLRDEAYRSGKAVYDNDFHNSERMKLMPEGHVRLDNVLFAPLTFDGKTAGLIGLANKPGGFTDEDAKMAEAFSDLVAVALRNTRDRDALEESEEKYRTLFEDSPEAMSLTMAGKIAAVNPAWLELHKFDHAEEVIGMDVMEIIHPGDREILRKRRETPPHELSRGYEIRDLRKDGSAVDVEVYSSSLSIGGKDAILTTVRDITDRKRAEEEKKELEAQLLQAQKMEAIGTLAGGVAHDFNNMLTTILGFTDLSLLNVNKTDPLYTDLKRIRDAAQRAANLVRQLLLFSRNQQMEPRPLDLNHTVADLLKMLQRLIGEDITVETRLAPDMWTVEGDPGHIEQVIMNLAVNARDAMSQGGRITVSAENVEIGEAQCKQTPEARPGRFVCLSIADTGTGMNRETVERIFEPFFTTKGAGKGTGLGLSVVYGIVKQHNGWITVDSKVGEGTEFKVYLPAIEETAEEETKGKPSLEDLKGNGERVLLVEDEADVREFAAAVLARGGYAVLEADCMANALEVFEKEGGRFDLLLSDCVLPDGTGLQLAEQLVSRKPKLRVILGSGYTDDRSQWAVIRERGFVFVQKPYAIRGLLQAVRKAIGAGG